MKTPCSLNLVAEPRPGTPTVASTAFGRPPAAVPRKEAFLFALFALLLLAGHRAGLASSNTPLNGSSPRPFYVFAHNPNTLEDVDDALGAGANALEPDVQALDNCDPDHLFPLFVMHDDPCSNADEIGLTLDEYLDELHSRAAKYPDLSLIVFDIKHPAANPIRGQQILDSVRTHLNYDGVQIHVILSVAETNDGAVFDNILTNLGPLEGVMVDDNNNADEVVSYFFNRNYSDNIGYGDGTLGPGPNLPRAMDKAAWLRATFGYPKAVTYVYTLNHLSAMSSFIDGGVDGIIPDHLGASYGGSSYITDLLGVVDQHKEVRLAKRPDNPFAPALESYGLAIQTANEQDAGTDADLTFTLKGCRGSSTITVHTGEIYIGYETGRMEAGKPDWATMPSADLGNLQSITIHNDGGLQDGWKLQELRVSSARWLGADWYHAREYVASFNGWIDPGATVEIPLVPTFAEPLPTIQCPDPVSVPNEPNQCGATVSFSPAVDGPCGDVSAVCVPPAGSFFKVGQTIVTCTAKSASGPESAPCSFTVTVQDTQLPLIACPAPMVINATSPAGATVAFSPTATDNCPGATVGSVPASGSVFAIGDTTVTCTAVDGSANQASCSFNVHVKGALEQTSDLITVLQNLSLDKPGVKNALLWQLNAALASLQNHNPAAACGSLQSFIDLVEAQRDKTISSAEADSLIASANQIKAVIGCVP